MAVVALLFYTRWIFFIKPFMKYITSAFLFGNASVIIVSNAIFTISLNPFREPLICKTMLFKSTIVTKYSGSIYAETDSFSRFLDNLVLLLFRKEPSAVDRDHRPCPKRSRKTPFISSFWRKKNKFHEGE